MKVEESPELTWWAWQMPMCDQGQMRLSEGRCRLAQSVRRNKMSRVAPPTTCNGIALPRRQLFSTASFRPVNMVLQVAEARSASS